jgi:hypothetical protein
LHHFTVPFSVIDAIQTLSAPGMYRLADYRPIGRRQVLQNQEPGHGRIAGMRRSGTRYPSCCRTSAGGTALTTGLAYFSVPFEIGSR